MAQSSAWIARITASFSTVGSFFIIYMIISNRKAKLVRPYHRIMLLLSIFDMLQSIAMSVTVAAIPRELGIDGAKGDAGTCKAQGFFTVLGLAVPLYNSCLNIYYVSTIRYSITSQRFAKFEPILHTVAVLGPLFMAILFTARDNMVPFHILCVGRGKVAVFIIPLVLAFCFLICTASLICICWTVISQASNMKKYTSIGRRASTSAKNSRIEKDKNETIKQAFLYFLAFLLTYTWVPIMYAYTKGNIEAEVPCTLAILWSIFYPLQGFWNFLFYIRPGVHLVMQTNPDKGYLEAIREVVFNPARTGTGSSRRNSLPSGRSPNQIPSSGIIGSGDKSDTKKSLFCTDDSYAEETPIAIELSSVPEKCDEPEEGTLGPSLTALQVQNQQKDPIRNRNNTLAGAFTEEHIEIFGSDGVPINSDMIQDICNRTRSNETASSLKHQEPAASTSMLPLTLCNSSDSLPLRDNAPYRTMSSEVSALKDGLELQPKMESHPGKQQRRQSLVNLASILNGEYDDDLDV